MNQWVQLKIQRLLDSGWGLEEENDVDLARAFIMKTNKDILERGYAPTCAELMHLFVAFFAL